MMMRSRAVLIGGVCVLVAAFIVLWVRSLERSWSEARVMPLFGDEEGQYERVLDETKDVFGELTGTWQRAITPPPHPLSSSGDPILPTGGAGEDPGIQKKP